MPRPDAGGGVCVISTLNLEHNRKNAKYQKASFHEKEFIASELRALLAQVFPDVKLYGLYPRMRYRAFRRMKRWGLQRWGAKRNPVQRFFDSQLSTRDFVLRPSVTPAAVDLMRYAASNDAAVRSDCRCYGDGVRGAPAPLKDQRWLE